MPPSFLTQFSTTGVADGGEYIQRRGAGDARLGVGVRGQREPRLARVEPLALLPRALSLILPRLSSQPHLKRVHHAPRTLRDPRSSMTS